MINEFNLKDFIDYCDTMAIATESTIGNTDVDKSINLLRNVNTWYTNLLKNVNYFSNARLYDQLNKDLLTVLQVSQARTESMFKTIPVIYKILSVLSKMGMGELDSHEGITIGVNGAGGKISKDINIKSQIHRLSTDITNNIKAAKATKEYKRIMKNEYTGEIKQIPLTNIIPDLKKSNSGLTFAENNLSKMKTELSKVKENPKSAEIVNQIIVFFNKVAEYYTFRIGILSKYFKLAKSSLMGVGRNLKEAVKGENASRKSFKKTLSMKVTVASASDREKIKDVYEKAKKAETYDEYKPLYDELIKLLKIKPCAIEKISMDGAIINIMAADETGNEITFAKGQKLYHTSANGKLKKLEPRWKTPAGILFPTPRIYFHINCPLDRFGNSVGSSNAKDSVYELVNNPDKVHVDRELGSTAVYVETTSHLEVKKIDYAEWKKLNDIKLGLEKKSKK